MLYTAPVSRASSRVPENCIALSWLSSIVGSCIFIEVKSVPVLFTLQGEERQKRLLVYFKIFSQLRRLYSIKQENDYGYWMAYIRQYPSTFWRNELENKKNLSCDKRSPEPESNPTIS